MKQIRRCMALALALMLALGAMGALAAGKAVAINRTNFPDAAFRKYVKAELDANKDGKPKSVGFTKSAISVKKGSFALEEKGVFIRMEPATAIYPVKITTKDTAVLALFEDGDQFCDARKKGTATVTISCGGQKGALKITVK